ncbi:MAG TPA: organic solvent tolerance protein OstA, partial [Pirellulales bacterium]
PQGTNWTGSIDYLSLRGVGGGTKFGYDRPGIFNPAGRSQGFIDAWYIDDHGVDNLGLDRRTLTFPEAGRGRTLGRFQEDLPDDWQLRLELGEVTDRNFLEQYYQQEWEEQKDQVTRLGARRTWDNMSLELSASGLVDPFFTQTQNLPRLDHFWLGQPLLNDTLTWYEHTNLGYVNQRQVNQPTDPTDYNQFRFLPYDVDAKGEKLATRQEIDWPFQVGPVKVVPYGLGELADWGDDLAGNRIQRAYGQVGVRSTMPMWSVDPNVHSELFNVNGVAHKVVFGGEFSYTNASRNVDQLVIFDPIDDNNIQALRRRLDFEDYNGTVLNPNPPIPPSGPFLPANVFAVPTKFDERFYAVRRGDMDWVTGPTEIADDLTVFRLDLDQRWQTKRGIPGQEHVIDWIALDTNFELFPKPEENFGDTAGMLNYDFHWFVGDRLTLVSYGGYDFFSDGQRYTSVGGFISRPPRGSLYLGFNDYRGGPNILSDVITASYTYRMSPKWLSTFGTSFDLHEQGNIGESFRLTRIGESFLFSLGVNVDVSRGNVGVSVALVPRFLGHDPSVTRGQIDIPPAGLYGLE